MDKLKDKVVLIVDAGVWDYFSKPLDLNLLLEKIVEQVV